MPGLGAFRRKPRTFDYKPRYYDPQKEARELRQTLFAASGDQKQAEQAQYRPGAYLRDQMLRRRGLAGENTGERARQGKRALLRLLIIVSILIALGISVLVW